jgi:hypothetical protein
MPVPMISVATARPRSRPAAPLQAERVQQLVRGRAVDRPRRQIGDDHRRAGVGQRSQQLPSDGDIELMENLQAQAAIRPDRPLSHEDPRAFVSGACGAIVSVEQDARVYEATLVRDVHVARPGSRGSGRRCRGRAQRQDARVDAGALARNHPPGPPTVPGHASVASRWASAAAAMILTRSITALGSVTVTFWLSTSHLA